MATFEKDCCVREYHIYQRVWDAAIDETLTSGENRLMRVIDMQWQLRRTALLLVTYRGKFHVIVHYS